MFAGVSLALLFAACTGDDDSSDDQGNGAPAATQTTNDSSSDDDDEGDGGEDSDFHACSLFTGAELGAALGVELADGRDYLATARGATNCTWEGDITVFVEVLLEDGKDWYDAIHIPDAAVGEVEEIEGVGDVAIWDDFLGALDVVEDDRFVSVQPLVGFSDLDQQEVAIQIAQLALERLP
jgi:hypothetical protein